MKTKPQQRKSAVGVKQPTQQAILKDAAVPALTETKKRSQEELHKELKQRNEAWQRTRQIGFASFVIPTSIILVMVYQANQTVKTI